MTRKLIASRVSVRHRYVRSVDLARDVNDPDALEGYVVTPSVRDAAIRILAGLSEDSHQRAFRIVGPYGIGKSAFGVFLARLLSDRGQGPVTELLSEAVGPEGNIEVARWHPVVVSGRRVSFARELLRVVVGDGNKGAGTSSPELKARAQSMLDHEGAVDAHEVTALVAAMAVEQRSQTGEGLLLLIDEMGQFLEYAATNIGIEDPSIFQSLAEHSGGRAGGDLAVVGFLHHGFVNYVAGMGEWIEAEWARSSERYEELSFGGSTEQSLFMLARALEPCQPHIPAIRRRAKKIYGEAVDRNLFALPRQEVVDVASNLYPLHPAAVAALALAIRRFGQNERSLFGFLQSLEPAGFKRFAHSNAYDADLWYLVPSVFDHLAATISESPSDDRKRRWSLAFDALANSADLPQGHRDVLKAVALVAVLEPVPGLIADVKNIAWFLGVPKTEIQPLLDELARRKLIYRRPHRDDYSLWSNSSVNLSQWLDEAKMQVRRPERLEDISSFLTPARPAVAHRHYHETGTLRTFEVRLWTGKNIGKRNADGLILVVPVYPGEDPEMALSDATTAVENDPLALVCARGIAPEDLKWAHELALWNWVRDNCDELKVDELARVEVEERVAAAERAMTSATALFSAASSTHEEMWWLAGTPVRIPRGGLSALLSDICDRAYNKAPILKNELINRPKLSSAVASARMRLLDRMLTFADHAYLGMNGTPPERTIYLSLFHASGLHGEDVHGRISFGSPRPEDPFRWGYIWNQIADRVNSREGISFAALMDDLAAVPFGLRAGPALLVIVAFVLASRDNVAIMERNSFQPDLTVAHFMRLAKTPSRFSLKSLQEGTEHKGIVEALATRLQAIGVCKPSVGGVMEKLFAWYNALPPYALKTSSISDTAAAVRNALGKASEPGGLLFYDLPSACGTMSEDGMVDVEGLVVSLDNALLELEDATPLLRSQAEAATLKAFGAKNMPALRSQIQNEYKAHRLKLTDYRLRAFVERAMNTEASPERWLDGIAGHLIGQRPDNWADDMLDRFDFEIRVVAGNLAKWLALARMPEAQSSDLRSVHVVGIDGKEKVIVVRRGRPNPWLATQLRAVRKVLGNDPGVLEVLGQLLVEYVGSRDGQRDAKERGRT